MPRRRIPAPAEQSGRRTMRRLQIPRPRSRHPAVTPPLTRVLAARPAARPAAPASPSACDGRGNSCSVASRGSARPRSRRVRGGDRRRYLRSMRAPRPTSRNAHCRARRLPLLCVRIGACPSLTSSMPPSVRAGRDRGPRGRGRCRMCVGIAARSRRASCTICTELTALTVTVCTVTVGRPQ